MFEKIRQVMGLAIHPDDEDIVTRALEEEGNTVVSKTPSEKIINFFTAMFQQEEA